MQLCTGGFGHTYQATSQDGETVAIKVLRIEKLDDWKTLELFEREARALRRIDHPKIPRYVEFFAHIDQRPVSLEQLSSSEVQPDALFRVQHYIDGADLQKRLQHGESFTTAQVADIVRQVLDILTYLHELHPPVVHRDINPRNLILGDEGRIYLVDFGAIQQKLREDTLGARPPSARSATSRSSSWICLLPAVFGLFGLALRRSKRPILYALAAMAVIAVGLACFLGTLRSSP